MKNIINNNYLTGLKNLSGISLRKLVFYCLLLCPISIISQPSNYNGWFFQNPLPGPSLGSVYFINFNTGFASGTLVKTTNAGLNWTVNYDLLNNGYFPTTTISFLNNCIGYTLVHSLNNIYLNSVMKSSNCGNNWTFLPAADLGSLFFTSTDTGYLASDAGSLMKTTNGALNWVNTSLGFNNVGPVCDFTSNNTGYVVGSFIGAIAIIAKTTDGGNSWSKDSIQNENLWSVYFPSASIGYVGGAHNLYKTTNAGINWLTLSPPAPTFESSLLDFTDANIGYLISNGGLGSTLFKTTNGGMNFYVLQNLNSTSHMFFFNGDTGYIVTANGDILYTSNGGLNFVNRIYDVTSGSAHNYRESIYSLYFYDHNNGYAGDRVGGIYKTTNAGSNWTRVHLGYPPWNFQAINDIRFVNASTGFAACDSAKILKTSNAGLNWFTIYSNKGGFSPFYSLYSIYFLDSLIAFAAGGERFGSGFILRSTNGGNNWSTLTTAVSNIFTIDFKDNLTGYAAGTSILYRTTDSGNSWNSYINFNVNEIFKILFVNSSTGFSCGGSDYTGYIYKTTNGGINWMPHNIQGGFYNMFFPDANTGYSCGFDGIVYRTTNSGENWFSLNALITGTFLDAIYFTDLNTGYVAGEFGTILKTTTGGGNVIGVKTESNNIPKEIYLHQNYPNPFNPSTIIRFGLSNTSFVTIAVYNILGQVISVLVQDNYKEAGDYSVIFDGSNLPSGVYFYRIEVRPFGSYREGYSMSKKMILLK